MKVIVVLSLVAAAFASLEPAGYRPPGSAPSAHYLPSNNYESASSRQAPSSRYLPATRTQYSAPARVSAPSTAYLPANEYETPAQTSASSSRYSEDPAASHGAPATQRYSAPAAAPANRYLPANSRFANAGNSGYRYNEADDERSEPAKYDFHYEVKDNYGNDFGHEESRDGDSTRGMYMVLLPDGRKQIVEYTADQDGYKPRISYEEPQQGYGSGYNRQGGQSAGYSQGRPQGPY